jgi:hypothetical protein
MAQRSKKNPDFQRTSIYVNIPLWRRFKATLALEGKDMSPVIEGFIRSYLDEHEAAAREAANQHEEEPL